MFNLKFRRLRTIFVIFCFYLWLTVSGCHYSKINASISNEKLKNFPPVILWAWERPENLQFIDTKKFGVAFLAQTLILQNDEVIFRPRRQPLEVAPETFLIAVTRIEIDKRNAQNYPSLSDEQKKQIVFSVTQTLNMPNVKGIQIDFDAAVSERNFYRDMLNQLRPQLPENVSLTMTALASWCVSDNWISGLPVDEAVPMAFRMGADEKQIRAFLASEKDWREPLCRASYGLATDEPLPIKFQPERRLYLFNTRSWRAADLKNLPEGFSQ
jgi:hypothetical protein